MNNTLQMLNKTIGRKSFLIGGQLLGAIRESKFLKNEHDIDLGILVEDYKEVLSILKKDLFLGKISIRKVEKTNIIRCIKFKVGEILVDIFLFYLIGDNRFNITSCDSFAFHKYPKEIFENLGEIEFFGKQYKCPNPPEAFLQLEYGDDWLIPRGNWSCCYDPPCVVWDKEELIKIIKELDENSHDRRF